MSLNALNQKTSCECGASGTVGGRRVAREGARGGERGGGRRGEEEGHEEVGESSGKGGSRIVRVVTDSEVKNQSTSF